MLPLRDNNPTRITPWATFLLIAASLIVYFGIQARDTPNQQAEFLYRRAAISCEIVTGRPLGISEIQLQQCSTGTEPPLFPEKQPWASVFVSMFLHGGVAHVLFNMWFLWIFGNNVEEAFGHLTYLIVYVVGGVAATLTYVVMNPRSTVPLVGASGAIAVVLGAYAVLFPGRRVLSLVGWLLLPIPAAVFLGIWLLSQGGLGGTNVAWEAHVGGFVFGFLIALMFRRPLLRRVALAG